MSSELVRKPWGEEHWLRDDSGSFVVKVIAIRAGCKTSLQYHRTKEEANVVVAGTALLHLRPPGAGPAKRDLGPGSLVEIEPGTVHRIEAVTDVVLCEVSTPEVEDVVRLADDYGRADGRVDGEREAGR